MSSTSKPAVLPRQEQVAAGVIRAWYVMAYRVWRSRLTGRPSYYGSKPIARWDGGTDSEGRVWRQPVWPRLARYCLEHQFQPERLITLYFEQCGPHATPIPTHLTTPQLRQRYSAQLPAKIEELERLRQSMLGALNQVRVMCKLNQVTDVNSRIATELQNPLQSFTPIFRYCLLDTAGATEAAAHYFDAAVVQYVFDREAYETAWKELLPASLKRAADQLCARMTQGVAR
jgi:hypothetical protein